MCCLYVDHGNMTCVMCDEEKPDCEGLDSQCF